MPSNHFDESANCIRRARAFNLEHTDILLAMAATWQCLKRQHEAVEELIKKFERLQALEAAMRDANQRSGPPPMLTRATIYEAAPEH